MFYFIVYIFTTIFIVLFVYLFIYLYSTNIVCINYFFLVM